MRGERGESVGGKVGEALGSHLRVRLRVRDILLLVNGHQVALVRGASRTEGLHHGLRGGGVPAVIWRFRPTAPALLLGRKAASPMAAAPRPSRDTVRGDGTTAITQARLRQRRGRPAA